MNTKMLQDGKRAWLNGDGPQWMRDRYAAYSSTRCGKIQHVYQGEGSLKQKLLRLLKKRAPALHECTLYTNQPDEYKAYQRERRALKRTKQSKGRYKIYATHFITKLTDMAEQLLQEPPTIKTIMHMILPLMFSLSARINECDPTNQKRKDNHLNKIDDFEINGWLVTQYNGSKNPANEPRAPRTKVLMLSPTLTQRMLVYVFSTTLNTAKDYNASKFFTQYPSEQGASTWRACEGGNNLQRALTKYGLCDCMTELGSPIRLNGFRAAALTLLPYAHNIEACGKGLIAPVAAATRANAGHGAHTNTYQDYINNEVLEPPAKRVKLCMHGDDLAIHQT